MISDALWNEIARALQACYPERAPAMLRELEKDRNVARFHLGGAPVPLRITGLQAYELRGSFVLTSAEEDGTTPLHGVNLEMVSVGALTLVAAE